MSKHKGGSDEVRRGGVRYQAASEEGDAGESKKKRRKRSSNGDEVTALVCVVSVMCFC